MAEPVVPTTWTAADFSSSAREAASSQSALHCRSAGRARWTRPLVESAVLPAHAQATMGAGLFFNSSPIELIAVAGDSIMDQLFPRAYANGVASTFQLCISVSGSTASVEAYVVDSGIPLWHSGTATVGAAAPEPLTLLCAGRFREARIQIISVGATVDGCFYLGIESNSFSLSAGACSIPAISCPV